ncbi:hypothetical protein AAV35_002400 [Salimicrobium jeotgali]|uniref:O-antigen polymerase n=1 Tax=Salimicrobium jeotgali TaxID=1230341 RepID=K2FK09_9BACI|nr:O-antigen ligase family protein [Salimicrobium jeotgali]AKG03752.1 hypothetical protein AAV35_002400 [Salimicrobium jeotgali]EKE31391.1 hypothetical protein MJ3_08456 [Salimicrobium jeotgali]MBM7696999.1 hypothetical protein [Salimicrobium jeotgali]
MQAISDNNKLKKGLEVYFLLYILLQPFLDITAFVNLPVSEPVRVLSMMAGVFYVVFLTAPSKGKKIALLYIGAAAAFFALNLINNYIFKDPFSLVAEITYLTKTAYVVMMIVIYYFVIEALYSRIKWKALIRQLVFWAISVVSIVMVVASITDTGKRSYGYLAKEGHSGWFFSGNEISIIIGMGFGFMLLAYMVRDGEKESLWKLPLVGLTIYAALTVGTKVALGSILALLAVGILAALIQWWKKKGWHNVVVLPVLLLLTVMAIPYTAIGNNLDLTISQIEEEQEAQQDNDPANSPGGGSAEEGGETADNSTGGTSQSVEQLLSSRGDFFDAQLVDYKEAVITQKLLGMGYGGNYEGDPKLVEMDFFDWFFNFGIIGFILLSAPIWFLLGRTVVLIVKAKGKVFTPYFLLTGTAVGLGLGAAFTAGHVLSSPASGFYLALAVVYLNFETYQLYRQNSRESYHFR